MNRSKMLTGDQLVAKGVTKVDNSLPEIGLKNVLPNGSWLEQKQIQAALEERRHLLQVERIEKTGTLSHAEWRDELKLAEVTQQVGGYWHFLGHSAEKKFYLRPEEALYLMEANCLLLKHNEVVVSLQKAYTLLLNDSISIQQYKVYASLSRIGYKVFRHRKINFKNTSSEEQNDESNMDNSKGIDDTESLKNKSEIDDIDYASNNDVEIIDVEESPIKYTHTANYDVLQQISRRSLEIPSHSSDTALEIGDDSDPKTSNSNKFDKYIQSNARDIDKIKSVGLNDVEISTKIEHKTNIEESINSSKIRLQALQNRRFKPCSNDILHKSFENIPDLYMKTVISINVPNELYIPRNVFVNNTNYMLNLDMVKSKPNRCSSNKPSYSMDEVNAPNIKRLRSSSRSETAQNNYNRNFVRNANYPRQRFSQFRHYSIWRSHNNMNHAPFNMFFQRPFSNNFFGLPQFNINQNRFFARPFYNFSPYNFISNRANIFGGHNQNDSQNTKIRHFQAIKQLANRLKFLRAPRQVMRGHELALQKLINLYNTTYNCNLRLTQCYDVAENRNIIETIDLNDEDEPESKRSRRDTTADTFDENLNNIKNLAMKLKNIESDRGIVSHYRRALSKVIKKFNKSYNADIYFDNEFNIINRQFVNLESSSDSDCVLEEPKKIVKRKTLRNPFSIMKQLSVNDATESNKVMSLTEENNKVILEKNTTSKELTSVFDKNWLPSVDDFGRPEVVPKCLMNSRLVDVMRDKYLYDFFKGEMEIFENWLDIKIAFLKYLDESNQAYKQQQKISRKSNYTPVESTGLKPLLRPEDCSNMKSILERLQIISDNLIIGGEPKYKIDFDVYNRDIKNFKKTDIPKPHFRIICLEESSELPAAEDVATLSSDYDDKIPIIFAVVGAGSISYVKVNCIDLPIYLPKT